MPDRVGQIVSGELPLGMWYPRYVDFAITAAPTVGYYDVDASSLPAGATAIYVRLTHASAAIGRALAVYTDNTPTPANPPVICRCETAGSQCDGTGWVTLDASRHFVYRATATLAGASIYMFYYAVRGT